jgi:hypothetical protein
MELLEIFNEGKAHVELITDVNRLTGLMICPKCGQCVAERDRTHYERKYQAHLERCLGGQVREVRLAQR